MTNSHVVADNIRTFIHTFVPGTQLFRGSEEGGQAIARAERRRHPRSVGRQAWRCEPPHLHAISAVAAKMMALYAECARNADVVEFDFILSQA